MDQLQNVISWFLNSRITNVRKVIGDKLIVNPAAVVMEDLQNRRPVIRLKASAAGEIDRHIKQLNLTDVTTTHVKDVKDLHDILKVVTGITDSLLGEVRPGRRSATENRNTTSGSAARIKTLAAVIFRFALEPLGRQMLSNLRDGLDSETYVRLLGQKAAMTPEFIKVSKTDLVGHYDFEIFDGTLPSERQFAAQTLNELMSQLIANPQVAVFFNIDPRKLLNELLLLRGIRNPERFQLDQQPQPGQAAAQRQPGAATQFGGNGNGNGQPSGGPDLLAGGLGGPSTGLQGALPESLLPLLAPEAGGRGARRNG